MSRRKIYARGRVMNFGRCGHGSKRICPRCGRLAYIRFRWCDKCMARAAKTRKADADAAAVQAVAASSTVRTFAERVVSGIVSTIRRRGGNG